MNRYEAGIEFDSYVAKYYCQKQQQCKDRGIGFNLTLTQVKNMLRAKRCQLSGISLTHTNAGKVKPEAQQRGSDVTIDRIDCSKPYEKGNVIAVAHAVNQIKSMFENRVLVNMSTLHMISKNLKKKGF